MVPSQPFSSAPVPTSSLTQPLFKRFIQVGRVVLIQRGYNEGKLAVVIDVVDHNRAFVDGPLSGVKRQSMSFKNLAITDIVIKIPRYGCQNSCIPLPLRATHHFSSCREKTLKAAWEKADVTAQWEKTAWAKTRAARATRAASTDFDRFKINVAKHKRNLLIRQEQKRLAKAGSKK